MGNGTNTIKKIVQDLRSSLSELYGEREAMQLSALLFRHYAGWNRADLQLKENEEIDPSLWQKIREAQTELMKYRPIQYIIGITRFLDATLRVRSGVLIPRPETEELVRLVISENCQREFLEFSVLDIGTGSGCIAIALRKAFPYANVDAVDKSMAALRVAAENAGLNKVTLTLKELDMLDAGAMDSLPGYHLIISNPPYVTERERELMSRNVLDYEPHDALFVPEEDPLVFYRAIGIFAVRHLIRPGTLYLEINERFGPEVRQLLLGMGFDRVEVLKDDSGKDRFVRAEAKHSMSDTSYWMVDKQLP